MRKLTVSVDTAAAIRESRKERQPDPVAAAIIAEFAGADGISIHLRMDKKHIRDRDLYILRETVKTSLNLHIAPSPEMIERALEVKPPEVTLLPEHAGELATEQGLDLRGQADEVGAIANQLSAAGCRVYALIDPDPDFIKPAAKAGLNGVEFFAHNYTASSNLEEQKIELTKLAKAFEVAQKQELETRIAGGLDYVNVLPILQSIKIPEFIIGHNIFARALITGLEKAVRDMVDIVKFY